MKELKLLLRVLITPSLWSRYGTYCKVFDKLVREQIKDLGAVDFDSLTIGNLKIGLHSHDFGTSISGDFISHGWRCSRCSMVLLKDYIEKATEEEYRKRFNKLTKAMK